MKTLAILSATATFLLLSSGAICGAWMSAGAGAADSLGFHTACGIGGLALSGLTILLTAIALRKRSDSAGRKGTAPK